MRSGALLAVGLSGKSLGGDERRRLEALQPGALLLRPRNVDDVDQVTELVAELRRVLPEVVLAVDAEPGRVNTLEPLTGGAPAPAALAAGSASLAYETGRWLGHAVALFDIDLDLAPVVDLDRGEEGNALDGRTLGRDAEAVTGRARALLRGLQTAGVGGCLKHFPGLGGATEDTHARGSAVYLPRKDLEQDLQPFRELGELAGVVMVGHANYPAFDRDGRPATVSPVLLDEVLRREVGFGGVVLSDDLGMKALDGWGTIPERAEAAFTAGCDLLLVGEDLAAAEAAAERLGVSELAERRALAGERLARLRDSLRSLAVRHEQERLDAGVMRGFDLEEVVEKLGVLRESAERQAAGRGEAEAAPAG
jgi:beta-N-acetylhexosaminidase